MSSNTSTRAATPTQGSTTTPVKPDRAVYTVAEVAELLGLSLGGTYAMVRAGEIHAKKMRGRWVVPKRRFHAWLDGQVADDVPGTRSGV